MKYRAFWERFNWLFLLVCTMSLHAYAQTSAFTYQGELNDGGVPASGPYDMQFKLFDSSSGSNQIGATQTITNVHAVAGIFTVQLDFGDVSFSGSNRFIEIGVSPAGMNNYTTLAPRQAITSAPHAIRAVNATNSQNLGGIAADQYVRTNDIRLFDARMPLPGSSNYLQNTGVLQPGVSFNVGGTGTAGILNAGTQFNLGGNRILSNAGLDNLFVGILAGGANTTGSSNSFFGLLAGSANTTGGLNSFFGKSAGGSNTSGAANSFFGFGAGLNNTTGLQNTFIGISAGANIVSGGENTIIGSGAGPDVLGTGSQNTFIGTSAGRGNVTGSSNTLLGYRSDVGQGALINATAVGYRAQVTAHNSLVLGGIFGINGGVDTNVGIGTTAPQTKLHIKGAEEGIRIQGRAGGNGNVTYLAFQDGEGTQIGYIGDGSTSDEDLYLASYRANVHLYTPSGAALTATPTGNILMNGGPNVLGANANSFAAQTIDTGNFKGMFTPNLFLSSLDTFLASPVHVCARIQPIGGSGGYALTRCSSPFSSADDKTDMQPFLGGMDIIRRLKPLRFKWKANGSDSLGLNAEDVAEVEPLLISRNEKDDVGDVSEASLQVILINAIRELEERVDRQRQEIEELKRRQASFDAVKKMICQTDPQTEVCLKDQK